MRPVWLNFPCHHLVKDLERFFVGRGDVVSYMLVRLFAGVHSNYSSSGVNLTSYRGVIFRGSYFISKKQFKELFFRSKNHPRN